MLGNCAISSAPISSQLGFVHSLPTANLIAKDIQFGISPIIPNADANASITGAQG